MDHFLRPDLPIQISVNVERYPSVVDGRFIVAIARNVIHAIGIPHPVCIGVEENHAGNRRIKIIAKIHPGDIRVGGNGKRAHSGDQTGPAADKDHSRRQGGRQYFQQIGTDGQGGEAVGAIGSRDRLPD